MQAPVRAWSYGGLMRRHLFVLLEIICTKVRGIWMSEKSEYVFYIVT